MHGSSIMKIFKVHVNCTSLPVIMADTVFAALSLLVVMATTFLNIGTK
jgi:hypothetical protein